MGGPPPSRHFFTSADADKIMWWSSISSGTFARVFETQARGPDGTIVRLAVRVSKLLDPVICEGAPDAARVADAAHVADNSKLFWLSPLLANLCPLNVRREIQPNSPELAMAIVQMLLYAAESDMQAKFVDRLAAEQRCADCRAFLDGDGPAPNTTVVLMEAGSPPSKTRRSRRSESPDLFHFPPTGDGVDKLRDALLRAVAGLLYGGYAHLDLKPGNCVHGGGGEPIMIVDHPAIHSLDTILASGQAPAAGTNQPVGLTGEAILDRRTYHPEFGTTWWTDVGLLIWCTLFGANQTLLGIHTTRPYQTYDEIIEGYDKLWDGPLLQGRLPPIPLGRTLQALGAPAHVVDAVAAAGDDAAESKRRRRDPGGHTDRVWDFLSAYRQLAWLEVLGVDAQGMQKSASAVKARQHATRLGQHLDDCAEGLDPEDTAKVHDVLANGAEIREQGAAIAGILATAKSECEVETRAGRAVIAKMLLVRTTAENDVPGWADVFA